ncbi:MAG: hypothetical protein JO356_03405, partial [Acidobacteria bacterium]|nr:hypothetical protein [Acidobacteriota bacterium]
MAHIALNEALGLDVDGSLSQGEQITKLIPTFSGLKDKPLDKVPIAAGSIKLSFDKPIPAGAGELSLLFSASADGGLVLIGPGKALGDGNLPLDDIRVNPGELYLGMKLKFALGGGLNLSAGASVFGFVSEKDFEIWCYRCFRAGPAGFPSYGHALGLTLASFSIPRTASELDQIDSDTVVLIQGSGEMDVSGAFSIQTPVQSIASVSVGFGKEIRVRAGGSFGAQLKFSLQGSYGIRLRRAQGGRIELGIFNSKNRQTDLSVSAQLGVNAGIGDFDLIEKLISALSRQPEVDSQELSTAIPGDDATSKRTQILAFQRELANAVSTRLEASVKATLSTARSSDAMWMFEIELATGTSEMARTAIEQCLHGDFIGLTTDPQRLVPAVTQTKNLLTKVKSNELTLHINLFGILNLFSLVQIARISKVERNNHGDVTLVTDVSDVSRLNGVLLNAGWDEKRLRKLLSEEFLISATYQVSGVGVLPPEFQARHTYLEISNSTSQDIMRNHLDIARVLGLLSPDDEGRYLSADGFGRTTYFVETTYSSDEVRGIFLDSDGRPKPIAEFENDGRSALGALLAGRKGQEFRLLFAQLGSGDALWREMKRIGNVADFGPLFGIAKDATDVRVATAGADFSTITSWAKAMYGAALATYEVQQLLGGEVVRADDRRLQQARDRLNSRLAEVLSDTHDEFGDPLGLLMVYVASNESASKR